MYIRDETNINLLNYYVVLIVSVIVVKKIINYYYYRLNYYISILVDMRSKKTLPKFKYIKEPI